MTVAERARANINRQLFMALALENNVNNCPICTDVLQINDEEIVQLPCHYTHTCHKECWDGMIVFYQEKNQDIMCPYCRKIVDKN